MSTIEIKERLIKKIKTTKDKSLLNYALEVLSQQERVPPFKLSAGQKKSIQRGLDDVKAGRVVSDEDFQKELDTWFAERE